MGGCGGGTDPTKERLTFRLAYHSVLGNEEAAAMEREALLSEGEQLLQPIAHGNVEAGGSQYALN